MLKRTLAYLSLLSALVLMPANTLLAATYGSGTYSACKYVEGCAPPVVLPPSEPPNDPPADPETKERDVDNDGQPETATDSNNNQDDGFEEYNGDGSSVIEKIDGDDDGKVDFIINTDDDSFPERYWDPDDDILSTIQLTDCDSDDSPEWRFNVGDKERTYDPDTKTFIENCVTKSEPNTNPGSTGAGNGNGRGSGGEGKTRLSQILPLISSSPAYEAVGEAIKKVPEPIAYGFPYFLLFLIVLLIARLIIQSRQELNRLRVAALAQQAEKQLVTEKTNFMMLSSHYLRTPLTVIQGNIELMQSLKQINEEVGKTLSSAGKLLLEQVSSLLGRLEEDKKLSLIQASTVNANTKTFVSPRLVLPIIGIIMLMAVGQFLFIDFRVVTPKVIDMLIQIALLLLLIQTFLAKLRQRQLNRHNREDQERVLEEQRALDTARSQFITEAANNLEAQLAQFKLQLGDVINKPEAAKVKNALTELERMISKFRLVAYLQGQQLQAGKEQFTLREVVEQAIGPYMQAAQTRAISVNDKVENGQLFQQKQLLGIILASLMDNAVKYTSEDGEIEVIAANEHGESVFTIKDNGKGIPKDRQEFLFKPFSRADSVEQFNAEGLGFSLYLDKVIANYLQGDISVNSEEGKGTEITVRIPATI